MNQPPRRVVCLSAEAADWLWRIGAWDCVVGTTSFFKIPPGTAPKPRIAGFSTADVEQIANLKPDLIVTFSDVQAAIAAELIRKGFTVLSTNQGTLAEVEKTLALLGRIVKREAEAERCLTELRRGFEPVASSGVRPRVYFEEWNDPLVCGISWISELIERAGGEDVFAELRTKKAAMERSISPAEVRQRDPEIIFASWCGRPMRRDEIESRPGWDAITAIREKRLYEIPGEDILQPGFRLVYGYQRIKAVLESIKNDSVLR